MSAGSTVPQRILPYYQPIVSVSDGMIYGYEVLGRFSDDSGRIWSMGPYFSDPEVSNHEKLIRSRKIREMAFLHARDMEYDGKLFINVKPSWLVQVHRSGKDIPTLKFIQEMGINGENIVIEITEEEFDGEIDILDTVMRRYREAGCKIAIDDFTFNNFDRLIHLRPDFVKIDIRLVKKSVEKMEYQKLITSISDFAQEIGISVLFEGVEYEEELVNSIHAGGSFIQGFLFSPPECDFQDVGRFRPSMHQVLSSVVQSQRDENFGLLSLEFRMNELIHSTLDTANFEADPDSALGQILPTLPDACYRAYVCNQFGEQLSSNFVRSKPGPFVKEPQFRNRNWGWRPYFLHNLTRMERFRRGFISNRYIDQETKRETFTYSHPLPGQMFLFLDVTRGSFASPESNG
ncbi:MAG: EAL domain-containing protein [Leptospirales bacterium]|nr:EAL domain-containing protein [Leptospirales bacterium]